MLFNSYEFLFLFLPLTWGIYFTLHKYRRHKSALWVLFVASLAFYAYWSPPYLALFIGSICINYCLGHWMITHERNRTWVLAAGVIANLAALGYFKYADFFISSVNAALAIDLTLLHVVLPIGISFFTFQQVAYLVDTYRGERTPGSFLNYGMFVSFFPHLIAGPLVHHKEMMPQFVAPRNWVLNYRNCATGLFLLTVGLFKKVIIADWLAVWVGVGFSSTHILTFFEAWIAALAYAFQIYFDFSGYTDMALGIALLFNIVLPQNFNSPYQATSIQDFWQRWHITLSRWLRDYLYIPLGGNRKGPARTAINVFIVFLLGGLWHGASWTFVVWGALHGAALSVQGVFERTGARIGARLAWLVTFVFVVVAWVFFRASTFAQAISILAGMVGLHGVSVPAAFATLPIPWVHFDGIFANAGAGSALWGVALIICAGLIAFFARNAQSYAESFKPSRIWFGAMALMFLVMLCSMNNVTEFIYFNF